MLAILVLPYMPDSPKVIIAASTIAAGTAFSGILLTQYFSNCCNLSSNCVIGCGI